MRAWEETWRLGEEKSRTVELEVVGGPRFGYLQTGPHFMLPAQQSDADFARARARLAAAAPEMARLLLEAHHIKDRACFDCGRVLIHRGDCQIVALLRKAGVLE